MTKKTIAKVVPKKDVAKTMSKKTIAKAKPKKDVAKAQLTNAGIKAAHKNADAELPPDSALISFFDRFVGRGMRVPAKNLRQVPLP